ncbi:Protein NRT1/ PTR FAMILY 4.7 [Linum grandiflorum]
MDEARNLDTWKGYVDWRSRPAVRGRHGGMLAASFVLVVEVLENLAFLANASNLVLYLSRFLHFSPSASANIVTNFMGTSFLLALAGGFLADAFLNTYRIYLISALIELMGLSVLTVQAGIASLRPPECATNSSISCAEANGEKEAMFFAGLYLVALGVGGIKGSLPPHGAEQFEETTQLGRKQRSSFFNYYVFCLSCGALIAVTFVVWIEDNKGWQWGFGTATAAILLSVPVFILGSPTYRIKVPTGSPITTFFKVLASAIYNVTKSKSPSNAIMGVEMGCCDNSTITSDGTKTTSTTTTESLEFLNRATRNDNNNGNRILQCKTKEVEEVKIVVKILPIFMSTIMLNCCLAQLSTFSVQQAATMNTRLGSFKVPPASLPIFPVIFIMILAPVYNHIIIPFARKITKSEMGITHLQRIGTGLVLSIVAMVVAALVETKRKRTAEESGLIDASPSSPLPLTFLWIALQYLFLGSADLFTLAGMMDFFFSEAPLSMRSLATSLSWASLAMGYYLSSVLVSLVNSITGVYRETPWLSGTNLNHYHLERFYWLMGVLSGINFLHYLFWARRYQYRSTTEIESHN